MFYLEQAGQRAPRLSVNRVGLARGSDSTGRVSPLWSPTRSLSLVRQVMPDILQGAREHNQCATDRCKLVPAVALPGLAANLAVCSSWSGNSNGNSRWYLRPKRAVRAAAIICDEAGGR